MKLIKIEDYGLNTYLFHFEGSIQTMAYIEDNHIHVIQPYEHFVRLPIDDTDERMVHILEFFYRHNKETWRPRTFELTPQFKKLMKDYS